MAYGCAFFNLDERSKQIIRSALLALGMILIFLFFFMMFYLSR